MIFLKNLILSIGISFVIVGCGNSEESSKTQIEEQNSLALQQTNVITFEEERKEDNNKTDEVDSLFEVNAPSDCDLDAQKKFIYDVLHDSYFWADDVPYLEYWSDSYKDSESILSALKDDRDKFSFIADAEDVEGYFEDGKNNNFGFDFLIGSFGNGLEYWVVNYVYPNSPADKAGIKRSDIIVGINDNDIRTANRGELIDLFYDEDQLVLHFIYGDDRRIILQKSTYDIDTILHRDVVFNQDKSAKIGYFVFQDFIGKATHDLDNLFGFLKRNNISELILDLRYNRGGYMYVATHLASLIGGRSVSNKIFAKSVFNSKYQGYDYNDLFEEESKNSLNLERVFIITTESTCSASEAVINGLKASENGIEVIQIGDTTCGKPHGFYGLPFCDKYLFAINFEVQNSDGYGNYLDGLSPTCRAYDDINYQFGDIRENSLAEALYYIDNGHCSSSSRSLENSKSLQSPIKNGFKKIMSAY